jgi:cyclopropane fatty-acyl-phospholipid synthase-like methyltransferase
MNLKEGMRILELGAGNCLSSIYIAKEYDIEVFATDLYVNPNSNWERIKEENVEDNVIPIKMDARNIPFSENGFS